MNKKEFLQKLDDGLKKIEKKEREQVLDFYNNYIDEATDEKNTEEVIIEKLGDTRQIVNKIKNEYHVRMLDEVPHIPNLLRAIISTLKRVSLSESIKVSTSVSIKLILVFVISLILLILGIGVFIAGTTSSLVFLYSSVLVLAVSAENVFILIASLLLYFLIAPAIISLIILIIYVTIKIGKKLFDRCKRKFEKIIIIFDWCILVPMIVCAYVLVIKNFVNILPLSLVFLEALSIITAGITGITICLIVMLSKFLNRKTSKSLSNILLKLEGEKV